MVTGVAIADCAINGGYIGIPYSQLDCQAFVEVVLKKAGLKIINYRGSNHMWRELVEDRFLIRDAESSILPGMLVFTVRDDGGETKRGYHDDMGNAVHVGIALGDGRVIHSTKGGVQYGRINTFNHAARIKGVDYDQITEGGGTNEDQGQAALRDKLLTITTTLSQIIYELEGIANDLYRNP